MMHKANNKRNNAKDNKVTCPRCGAKFNPDKGLDLAGLAAMINEGKDANRKEQKPDWAKNSRYYGTDICGYAYNPYMVRRWITAQFLELMNNYNLKIEDGIRHEYNYMYSIDYIVKEAKKMAMLEKRDPVAFEERKWFWTPKDMAGILNDYVRNIECYVWAQLEKYPEATSINLPGTYKRVSVYPTIEDKIGNKTLYYRMPHPDYTRFIKTCDTLTENLRMAVTYDDVAQIASTIRKVKLPGEWNYKSDSWEGFKFHKAFIEGFKKSGAYYTLKNLVMFEGFKVNGLTGRYAVKYLEDLLTSGTRAYQFYAILKRAISENN